MLCDSWNFWPKAPLDFSLQGDAVAGEITTATFPCCTHSAVLGMKPVFKAMGDVPSKLAKLGHLLESGRNSSIYKAQVSKLLDGDGFEYKLVDRMPPEYDDWQRYSRHVMKTSRVTRNLTPEEEDLILSGDNGDWKNKTVQHWCLRGSCPLKCTSARHCKAMMKNLLSLSVCSKLEVCLVYRWKAVEVANGWVLYRISADRLAPGVNNQKYKSTIFGV